MIVCFNTDREGVAGKYLDQLDPSQLVKQLLQWQFRQAVFANMRGMGEPAIFRQVRIWLVTLLGGPRAAERMEFGNRLIEGF